MLDSRRAPTPDGISRELTPARRRAYAIVVSSGLDVGRPRLSTTRRRGRTDTACQLPGGEGTPDGPDASAIAISSSLFHATLSFLIPGDARRVYRRAESISVGYSALYLPIEVGRTAIARSKGRDGRQRCYRRRLPADYFAAPLPAFATASYSETPSAAIRLSRIDLMRGEPETRVMLATFDCARSAASLTGDGADAMYSPFIHTRARGSPVLSARVSGKQSVRRVSGPLRFWASPPRSDGRH